eukprot:scaffold10170_cov94-Skeletonema_marinoi.AAC.1
MLAAVSDASSGHLRRCSDADTVKMSLSREKRCFYTIMANYDGSLEDVDCHTRCVRYDIVLESNAGGRIRCQMPHQVTYDVVATLIR